MFRETLLESAPSGRKRKRWPMALAFTMELIVTVLLLLLPLLYSGAISVSAHVPLEAPLRPIAVVDRPIAGRTNSLGRQPAAHNQIVAFSNNAISLTAGSRHSSEDIPSETYIFDGPITLPNMPATCSSCQTRGPHQQPPRPSVMSEGHLVNRIEPLYPKIAILTGIQGEVKLHAIIARDGSIESLGVVSGHPLLVRAAVDAVKQWRYRPYYLNGEPVEVETLITVNFKKTND